MTSDLEVLKAKQTAWAKFMYEYRNGTAATTLMADMPVPMKQSLLESFECLGAQRTGVY